MKNIPPIKVWRFEDAPLRYRKMSTSGGDEDWVAYIPKEYLNGPNSNYIPWAEEGSPFGCCSVDIFTLPDGDEIRIGSHA